MNFEKAYADEGSLGVVAHVEGVAEAGAEGDDILESAEDLDGLDVLDEGNAEVTLIEYLVEDGGVFLIAVPDGRLTELAICNLIGDVRATEHGHVNVELVLDDVGHQNDAMFVEVDALDKRNGDGIGGNFSLEGLTSSGQELMRKDENEDITALGGIDEVGDGDDVGRQGVVGEVLDVAVVLVNDFGELAAIDDLLVDPHGDGILVVFEAGDVAADYHGGGRPPVTGTYNAHALHGGCDGGFWRGRDRMGGGVCADCDCHVGLFGLVLEKTVVVCGNSWKVETLCGGLWE